VFKNQLRFAAANGLLNEAEAKQMFDLATSPEAVKQVTSALIANSSKDVQAMLPKPKFGTAAPGSTIYDENTGQPTATTPKEPTKPPSVQEYEYYVQQETAAGRKPLTFDEYQTQDANRKHPVTNVNVLGGGQQDFSSQRPDPKIANKKDPTTGLTPNSIYNDGMYYALTGQIPTGSRSTATVPAQMAVRNTGNAMLSDAGVTPGDLRNEYAGAKAATRSLMSRYQFSAAAASAASSNIEVARQLAAEVPRTGAPVVNRYAQAVLSWAGGRDLPGLTAYETAIYTAVREYAKVTSGAAGSVAGVTDGEVQMANKLLNAAQTPAQFDAVTAVMKRDMDNFIKPMEDQIAKANDVGPSLKRFMEFIGGRKIGGGASPTSVPPQVLAAGPGEHTFVNGEVWKVSADGKSAERIK
jgi:hypothetical protein